MRLKAVEATEVALTMSELKEQIISKFQKGDTLHVLRGKRKVFRKEVAYVCCYDSFFMAEAEINAFYKETISIAFADLLVGSVVISEIQTKKPIEKKGEEVIDH